MTEDKAGPVLDAAESLLAEGSATFSMRDLAERAGVSFATPFNRFGSKGAIMLALSARRIAEMQARLARGPRPDRAVARVLLAADVAAAVMVAAPAVNRAVMAAIGSPGEIAGDVSARSAALWREALGAGEGLTPAGPALEALPFLLAVAFRGVLSFWTAGELPDALLASRARAAAAVALLGFAEPGDRAALLALLTPPESC